VNEGGEVDGTKDFQEKLRRLGTLVGELDQMPGGGSKVAARELIQLLMEVHGAGLERMMEIVFDAGGSALIDRVGEDPIVRHLLLLYSLHPEDMEGRVARAVEVAQARLRKFDTEVELSGIQNGAVRLRLHTSGHACGSTTKNLKAIVEEAMYDQAPDLASLTIVVPEEEASSFVSIQSLMKRDTGVHDASLVVEVEGGD
jgi:hypothetical protein